MATWTGQPLMYRNMVPHQGCNPCSSVVHSHLFQVVLNLLVESPRLHQVCGNLWCWEGLKDIRDLCAGAGAGGCYGRSTTGMANMKTPLSMAWYEVKRKSYSSLGFFPYWAATSCAEDHGRRWDLWPQVWLGDISAMSLDQRESVPHTYIYINVMYIWYRYNKI